MFGLKMRIIVDYLYLLDLLLQSGRDEGKDRTIDWGIRPFVYRLPRQFVKVWSINSKWKISKVSIIGDIVINILHGYLYLLF